MFLKVAQYNNKLLNCNNNFRYSSLVSKDKLFTKRKYNLNIIWGLAKKIIFTGRNKAQRLTLKYLMKRILQFLIMLTFAGGISQNAQQIVLEWVPLRDVAFGEFSLRMPEIKNEGFSYDYNRRVPFFHFRIPVSFPITAESVAITDLVYETVSASELGDLSSSNLPADISVQVKNVRARDDYFAHVTLSPIINQGGIFQKVVSFRYVVTPVLARLNTLAAPAAVSNSLFATGDVYRFYVEKSGVYKLSRGFLQSLGLNTSGDPRNIKIYGSGGRMVPLLNATPYPLDPEENAIQVVGEEDGTFDSQDYILFYAEGLDNWNQENQTHNNLYATRSYYYVTAKGGSGKRILPMDPLAGQPATPITIFDDYQYHERDLNNIGRLGRRWFGEEFSIDNEQDFTFSFPNIVSSEPIRMRAYFASAAFATTNAVFEANGQLVGTLTFPQLVSNGGREFNAASLPATTSFPAAQDVTITVTYNNNGVPGSRGYLDYIILTAKRALTGTGKQFRFKYDAAATLTGVGEFQITNASGISQVWDITDIYNVTSALNNGQANFSFRSPLGEVRRFIAVDANDYFTPLRESRSRVANQDIKGTIFTNAEGQSEDVDYLIVAPANLTAKAEKLAGFHRSYSGLNVKVLALENIYQEFSSGKQDIGAIRNMVRYVYENASAPAERVKYLCLFGDASYDVLNRIPNNTNIVPTYGALNGETAGEASFNTDDFYGMLDPDEGRIDSPTGGFDLGGIDVSVGRLVVDDNAQAEDVVNKVIDYHDLQSYGSWRNNIVMISDDVDKTADASLQFRQNQLADVIFAQKPFFNIRKIFLDAYEQETSSGGNRYPKARQDIFNAFEKGALVFNYLGHGGEDGLAQERIWEKSDSQNLQNRYKYPLFITITCEFSRFDNPFRPTAGEFTFWNPRGGAVSMITTVRSILQGPAENFNDRLSQFLFGYGLGTGLDVTIAEALRRAKNSSPSPSTNVIFFLGDPAMKLAIPKPQIRLTKINDQPITGPVDDFKALSFVKLSGEVTDENNILLSNYTGELSVNIFDKNIQRTVLNNDGFSNPLSFSVQGETIFRGNASINNGQFEFGFVVPRDIRVPVGNGRVSFYGRRNQILLDKTGYNNDIKVGGINENAVEDNVGPTVKLFMNDQTFVSGGITNENPIFLAFLEDEHGINTASGIGHDIIAILDGDESNPYILNDYYETELDDFKRGKLRFPFRNLEKGLHTITFRAWDVYNNPVTAEIQFVVVDDESITLKNVLNYPNPFVDYTQFWFTHNRPFEPLDVQIQVITVTGKVVWTRNQVITTDGFLSREITWDGRDDFGDRIGKGVYIYKLTVRSTLTNDTAEKFEKLVIL